jgi:alcohol dehydrogenase YqhD (iron-dependent ADH family)
MITMPMPPNHCNKALHNNIVFGYVSRFVKTVAPVVVMADAVSNKASVKDRFKLENIKGRLANIDVSNHAKKVNRNISRVRRLFSSAELNPKINPIPINKESAEDIKNGIHWVISPMIK